MPTTVDFIFGLKSFSISNFHILTPSPLFNIKSCNHVTVSAECISSLKRGRGGLAINEKDVFIKKNYGRTLIESVCFAQMCQHLCP